MPQVRRSRLLNFVRRGGGVEDPGLSTARRSSMIRGKPVSECRLCGSDIRWVVTSEGDRISIDARGTHQTGEGRWMEREPGSGVVEAVSPTADVSASIEHRYTCPYGTLDVGGRGEAADKSRARNPSSA